MVRNDTAAPLRQPRSPKRLLTVAVASCFAGAPAWALDANNLSAVTGAYTASQNGSILTLTTATDRTLVEAQQRFNVLANEQLRVLQPSSASLFLLRVVPGTNGVLERSVIDGSIYSNGQFWLQNAAGALIGKGAVIDTAGFLATSMAVRLEDFMAARLTSLAGVAGTGDVINQGTIKTSSGGSVYLVGANVTNEGLIETPGGETILAAGQTVNLIDTGTPGVKVEVTGAEGNATNLGEIVATAGRIGMAGVIVRNSGTLNASSVVSEGGRVFLKASKDAYVDGAGRIVATGTKGGTVEVLGERVAVMDQAQIDVSGTNGGGTALVGGDYQGKNPDVQNAAITYFGKDAGIKADATGDGDGGKVIVWADDTTRAYGTISARGGANGGNGGFVETSGYRYLEVSGARVDTRAPNGAVGNWLLDPMNVSIVSGAYAGAISANPFAPSGGTTTTITDADINDYLTSTSLTIQTDGAGSGSGNISITNASISGSGNSLYLLAYGGAGGTGDIIVQGSTLSNLATLAMVAGWDGVGTTESDVIANTGNLSISESTIGSAVGIVNLYGGGNITFGSTSASVGTAVTSTAQMVISGKNVTAYGSASASAYDGTTHYGAGVWLKSGSTQTIKANTSSGYVSLYGGSVSSAEGGQLVYGGSVVFEGGDQTIVAYGMRLQGGASGHDNAAAVEASGVQSVVVYGGGIVAYGGGTTGSYNNLAAIKQKNNASGSQTITTYGGSIYLGAGAGTGGGGFYDTACGANCAAVSSNNSASIRNSFGNQTLDFYYGGNLTLVGGSGGANNEAEIDNYSTGTQKIWSSYGAGVGGSSYHPVITITGGSSGGTVVYGADLKYHQEENSAGISIGTDSAAGTQQIYANGITLTAAGSSTTVAGAYVGGYGSTTIISYGGVTLTGGAGTADANERFTTAAGIGNDKAADVTLAIYGGNLSMAGGSGTGGAALIGSTDYGATVNIGVYAGDISLTANKGAVMIGSASKTATATATKISVGASGNVTATASSDASGDGDVWIGSYGGPIGTAAGEFKVVAGKNLTTTGNAKQVIFGSYGGGPAEVTLRAGYDFTVPNAASASGGDIKLGTATLVTGNASPTAVVLETKGGSTYGGKITVDGTLSSSTGGVSVLAYGDVAMTGVVNAAQAAIVGAGYQSLNGGNLSMTGSSSVYGGTGATLVASSGTAQPAGTGFIGLTYVRSATGVTTVTADRAIYDNNGTALNAKGLVVDLTSLYGGNVGALAVSSDVDATNNLNVNVNPGATYGGISIRNAGTGETAAVVLNDDSATAGNATVSYSSPYSIDMTARSYDLDSNYGGIEISSSAAVTLNNLAQLAPGSLDATYRFVKISGQTGVSTTAALALGTTDLYLNTSGALTASGHAISARNLGLNASGGLTLTNAAIGASANVYLGGVNNYGGGAITLTNSSVTAGNSIYGYTGGDIRLNNGSYLSAAYDVNLGLGSTTSTVYLNDTTGYSASYIMSGSTYATNVGFLMRSSDGIVIDGATTMTSAAYGSGIFRGFHGTPAAAGAGLNVLYGIAATAAVTQTVTDVVNTITTTTTTATDSVSSGSTTTTASIPPPTTTTTSGGTASLSAGTVGGTAGTFGDTSTSTSSTSDTTSTTSTTSGGTTAGDSSSGSTSTATSSSTSGESSTTGESSTSSSGEQANGTQEPAKEEAKEEKKDEKKDDKKADAGEKKDDKAKQKPVGKCSA